MDFVMKKIKYFIILLVFSFFFLSKIVYATPTINTIKNLGGTGNEQYRCVITVDNGYVTIGQSDSINGDLDNLNKGTFDGIIAKYDFNYTKLWNKNFGGSEEDYFRGVSKSPSGSVAVGYSKSTDGDLTGLNKGSWDAIIVNYDSEGNVIWNKNFGSTNNDYFYGITNNNNEYTAVGSIENAEGINTATVVHYDNNGNQLWDRKFGGSNNDYFYSITNNLGNYTVAGSSSSTDGNLEGKNKGNADAILAKYDNSGNLLWNINIGGSSSETLYSIIHANYSYTSVGFSTSRDKDLQGLNKGRQDAIIIGFKEDFQSTVSYSTTEPTKEPVTVTIQTTEPIETPIGWTRVNDTTFTKEYTQNLTEEVVLRTYSGEEYTVTISITNIETDYLVLLCSIIFIFVIIICLYIYCHCVC